MTKPIYCANCQTETKHKIDIQPTEIVAYCECGRIVKFPPLEKAGAFRELLNLHKEVNKDQVKAKPYVPDQVVVDAFENA